MFREVWPRRSGKALHWAESTTAFRVPVITVLRVGPSSDGPKPSSGPMLAYCQWGHLQYRRQLSEYLITFTISPSTELLKWRCVSGRDITGPGTGVSPPRRHAISRTMLTHRFVNFVLARNIPDQMLMLMIFTYDRVVRKVVELFLQAPVS